MKKIHEILSFCFFSFLKACESAVKIARRWGYEKKGIPQNQARVIFVEDNFWGRSISAVSSSNDPESFEGIRNLY